MKTQTMKTLIVIAVLFSAIVTTWTKDLRQLHECPAYECDAFTGTGCKEGYACLPINCGDICVPLPIG